MSYEKDMILKVINNKDHIYLFDFGSTLMQVDIVEVIWEKFCFHSSLNNNFKSIFGTEMEGYDKDYSIKNHLGYYLKIKKL